jgi:hypothetical protein
LLNLESDALVQKEPIRMILKIGNDAKSGAF